MVATESRDQRPNAKEAVVVAKKYKDLRLVGEEIADVAYRGSAAVSGGGTTAATGRT